MVTRLKILIALFYVILFIDVAMSFYLLTRHVIRFAAVGGFIALVVVALLGILHRYLYVQRIIESDSVPYEEETDDR